MTSLGLYDSPDSVMEAVEKDPHSRLAACLLDRLVHCSNFHRLNLCGDRLSPEGRDGKTGYQQMVLDSFCRLLERIPKKSPINRLVCEDRFSIICNTLYQLTTLLLHNNNGHFLNASIPSM